MSILDTLTILLQKESTQELFAKNRERVDELYHDFANGTVAKEHSVLKRYPLSLQIIGYYDELEIFNPLGSSVEKHKLGLVFFSMGNINPKRCSTYKAIFLSTIAKVSLIEGYGIDAILKLFFDDLNVLGNSGVEVNIDG